MTSINNASNVSSARCLRIPSSNHTQQLGCFWPLWTWDDVAPAIKSSCGTAKIRGFNPTLRVFSDMHTCMFKMAAPGAWDRKWWRKCGKWFRTSSNLMERVAFRWRAEFMEIVSVGFMKGQRNDRLLRKIVLCVLVYVYAPASVCIHACVSLCMCLYMYTCKCLHVRLCTWICRNLHYMHVCMCVYYIWLFI